MKVVMVGAGNLATRLSLAMSRLPQIQIVQVYSHTQIHAEELAGCLNAVACDDPTQIRTDADLYLFSLKDTALEGIAASIPANGGLWIHTAGSMPMELFANYTKRYGVLYPLQTFSKQREIDFASIPLFLECKQEADCPILEGLARELSNDVRFLSSELRRHLHLAAVFACNFTNHMYVLAGQILRDTGIPEDVLLPLMDETAAKVHRMPAKEAQTGPAIRYDENVIRKHLDLLAEMNRPEMSAVYQLLSQSIHQYSKK